MDVAMEKVIAGTPIAAESVCTTMVEPMERNENRQCRRRSEAPVTALAPTDRMSLMERMVR
jgi:hypothetical protein